MMIDSTFLVVAAAALGLVALTIVSIEKWDRLSAVVGRWQWLISGSLGSAMAWTTVDHFMRGKIATGLLFGVNAVLLAWQAIGAFRRRRAAQRPR